MKVTVIGLGKIGLPLAVKFAENCDEVVGIDINSTIVELINTGTLPFPNEEDLEVQLKSAVRNSKLRATTNFQDGIQNSQVIVVVVPLVVTPTGEPDFYSIDTVTQNIAKYLAPGALICYETTLPVGTTKNRFTKTIEEATSKKAGIDFFVAFSPERVLTGRVFRDLKKYPKIVGGVTKKCSKKASDFYEKVLEFDQRVDLTRPNGVWVVENSETAEFVKLAETTYRDVNIGLANEFSEHAAKNGINIYEVIESSNSQPFSHIHTPGISVGGHCIPIYPQFYLWGDPGAAIVKSARNVNSNGPKRAIRDIKNDIGILQGKRVLILGLSYRPGVKESAYSGTFSLVKILEAEGACVFVEDPLFTDEEIRQNGLIAFDGVEEKIDVIILHTAHDSYKDYNFKPFVNCTIVYDGRNLLKNSNMLIKLRTLGNGSES